MKYIKDLSEEEINHYRDSLKNNDYVLIKNILTEEAIEYLRDNIKFGPQAGRLQFGRCHNLKDNSQSICNDYHIETFKLYKRILGEEYYTTYTL